MNDPQNEQGPGTQSHGRSRRAKGMLIGWGVLLIGSVVAAAVYFAFLRDSDDAAADLGQQGPGIAQEQAGIVNALKKEGLLPENADPSQVDGALVRGANGAVGGKHDNGQHATFTQVNTMSGDALYSLFPSDYVKRDQLDALKSEILAVRDFAAKIPTVEAAQAAGFYQATNDVPFMGEHWLNREYLTDGVFDPSKPEGLLFSTIDGQRKLVGVWFLQIPGIGPVRPDVEPAGFTSNLDLWHAHLGLCITGLSGASEGETRESCEAKQGSYTADLRWMMHVWVVPEATENPLGVFAYLNADLYAKQEATKAAANAAPSGSVAP